MINICPLTVLNMDLSYDISGEKTGNAVLT